jgi:hypothetical protein
MPGHEVKDCLLPLNDIPAGWIFGSVRQLVYVGDLDSEHRFIATIFPGLESRDHVRQASGPTARAAVLAAIAKIAS